MKELTKSLTWATIAGNILFILWITFNAVKENFRGTLPEKASYFALMGLLTINTILILRRKKFKLKSTPKLHLQKQRKLKI